VSFHQPQENSLQHVFGIGRAAGDAMSGAKDGVVM